MKIVKWLLGVAVGLVLLGFVAVAVLSLVVDPEEVKQEVAVRFEQQTGHSLRIDAPIEWSVFPWVGLHLEKVKVGNAPGFGDEPLASAEVLDVRVALMPLLKKQIRVDTVRLKGVELNLERDAKGEANWEGLTGGKQETAPAAKESGKKGSGYRLALKGIEVEKLDLNYRDRQKGESYRLQDLNVSVGEIRPDTPVMVRLSTRLDTGKPPVTLQLALSTEVTASADYQRIDLSALAVEVEAQGEGLPKEGVKLKLAANLALDLAAGRLAVTDLSLAGPQVDLTGRLSLSGLKQGKPGGEGELTLEKTDLRSLLKLAGVSLETADPKALSRVSAHAGLKVKGETLKVEPLELELDDSHAEGALSLLSFQGPVVRARLEVDAIDLDRYLPPEKAGGSGETPAVAAEKGQPADAGRGQTAARVDFTPLRRLDAEATLKVGKLRVKRLNLEQVAVTLKAKKGVITLDPAGARLYQGSLQAQGRLDVRKDEPVIQAGTSLVGIRIGPLLADLTGKDRLTGTGNVKFNLRTRGLEQSRIRRNLDGDFSISLKDGAYKGFNLAEAIRKARAMIKGEKVTGEANAQTDFSELRGTGVIRKGVVTNKDLYMASPVLRVKGEGRVDLVKEQIDYRLMAKIVGTLKGQGGESMEELKGIPIPVHITGPLSDPRPQVDAEALVKALAQKKIEEKKEEVMQKAGKKLEEKLGTDVLKGLFGK